MRIAIIGATGNVGTALLRRLVADGRHDVVGIARRPPADDVAGPVDWRALDLTQDECRPDLQAALTGADAVVHLAWGFQPSHRLDHLEELGVGGTRRVLDAAVAAGVGRLVHMSSLGAYSPKRDLRPVDEGYPTDGVPSSPYSRHKVRAERMLDSFAAEHPEVTVARLRPGIIGQRSAGSELLRYAVPALVPAAALHLVPVVPLDRAMVISMVHTDDVADAVVRCLEGQASGAFNLAADPPITVDDIASALGARHVQVPARLLRAAASGSWHLHLQKVDPGWVDLARWAPVLDSGRARSELGWTPGTDARAVLAEVVEGMREGAADRTPVLRARTVPGELRRMLTRGAAGQRRRP